MYVPKKKNPRISEPKRMCSRVSYVEKKKANLPIIKNQVRESQFVDICGFDGEESW